MNFSLSLNSVPANSLALKSAMIKAKLQPASKLDRVQSEIQPAAGSKMRASSKAKKDVDQEESTNPKMINDSPNFTETSPILNKAADNNTPDSNDLVGDSKNGNSNNNRNNNNYAFSRLDVPSGFLPPGFKDCLLSNVVRSARRSLDHLKEVRESLSNLVGEDEQLSKGIKKINPAPEILQLSIVAEALTVLTREAFVPTHRLNQTAIALYSAEDFLRYPNDLRLFDALGSGRIKVPDPNFNADTVQKLRIVVDKATEYYNKFNLKGPNGAELQDVMFTLMRAFQDLYTMMLGCQEVFKVLLYTNPREKANLQQFLLSLQSMERCDMLTEVQDLRRMTDELVIFLEKLSWGCFVVFRLASGKTIPPLQKLESEEGPVGSQTNTKSKEQDHHNLYPDLPFLHQGGKKGQNTKSSSKGKKPEEKRQKSADMKTKSNNEVVEIRGPTTATSKKRKQSSSKKSKGNKMISFDSSSKGAGGSSEASLYAMTAGSKSKKKTKSKVKF